MNWNIFHLMVADLYSFAMEDSPSIYIPTAEEQMRYHNDIKTEPQLILKLCQEKSIGLMKMSLIYCKSGFIGMAVILRQLGQMSDCPKITSVLTKNF